MSEPASLEVKAGWSTPLLHVREIERSIPFYERLGFEVIDTEGAAPVGWARLHCEGGAIMLLRAEHDPPFDPEAQAILFVLYTPDLPNLRAQLIAAGVEVPEIDSPPYMPSGVLRLRDPDGYRIEICHWGDKEHTAWLERIGRTPAANAG